MTETTVGLNLAHGGLDTFLPSHDDDLFERKQAAARRVPDQVDKRKAALAQQAFNLELASIDLERRVAGGLAMHLGVRGTEFLTACRYTGAVSVVVPRPQMVCGVASSMVTDLCDSDQSIACVKLDAV